MRTWDGIGTKGTAATSIAGGAHREWVAFPDGLLAILHAPSGTPRGAALICSPMYAGAQRAYRREVLLARLLAKTGWFVVRFRYRGSGNREDEVMTPDGLRSDAATALHELRRISGIDRPAVVGSREGAWVACEVARSEGLPVVLWEPILDRARYLRDLATVRGIHGMREGAAPSDADQQDDECASLEVAGHLVDRTVVEEAAVLGPQSIREGQRALILRLGRMSDEAWPFPLHAGVAVEALNNRESWWFDSDWYEPEEDRELNRRLIESTGSWLSANASGAPMDVPRFELPEPVGTSGDGTSVERTLRFTVDGETLFGVAVVPGTGVSATGCVVARGGGYTAAVNRDRLWSVLAERLATRGTSTLRFDYHGVGESTGRLAQVRMDRPFTSDVAGAVNALAGMGAGRLVLVGQCLGARTILHVAAADPRVIGVALIAPPLRDVARGMGSATRIADEETMVAALARGANRFSWRDVPRARAWLRAGALARLLVQRRWIRTKRANDPTPWVSEAFLRPFEMLIRRKVPILLVFGTEDGLDDFERARSGRLGKILAEADDLVRMVVMTGKVHGRTTLGKQDDVRDALEEWMAGLIE